MLIALAEQWKPTAILVEDRASGQSLLQELKSATTLPVLAVKVDSDKLSRAQAVTPLVEAGKVFVPEFAPWLGDYIDELAAFPMGNYDDSVDSTTQALNYFRERAIQPILFPGSLINAEDEKEMLWERAMRGEPLNEAEIAKL
jgi:phage terminase large subunit-like protein